MNERRIAIRIFSALLPALCVALFTTFVLCSGAHANSNKRFDFLLYLYDLNAEALSYQRHCSAGNQNVAKSFSKADAYITDTLMEEAIKQNPRVSPSYVKRKITERRKDLQYQLDLTRMEEGCNTSAITRAKGYYTEISQHDLANIEKLIRDRTGN